MSIVGFSNPLVLGIWSTRYAEVGLGLQRGRSGAVARRRIRSALGSDSGNEPVHSCVVGAGEPAIEIL